MSPFACDTLPFPKTKWSHLAPKASSAQLLRGTSFLILNVSIAEFHSNWCYFNIQIFWFNKYGFRLPERFLVADVCFRRIKKPLAYPLCCLVTQPGEVNCGMEQAQAIGAEVHTRL